MPRNEFLSAAVPSYTITTSCNIFRNNSGFVSLSVNRVGCGKQPLLLLKTVESATEEHLLWPPEEGESETDREGAPDCCVLSGAERLSWWQIKAYR